MIFKWVTVHNNSIRISYDSLTDDIIAYRLLATDYGTKKDQNGIIIDNNDNIISDNSLIERIYTDLQNDNKIREWLYGNHSDVSYREMLNDLFNNYNRKHKIDQFLL